jgi:light-regulated signal transduction histidine kinase (bacteriophytochrome)
MNGSKAGVLVKEGLQTSKKYVDYILPFVVASQSSGVLFKSDGFCKIAGQEREVLDFIVDNVSSGKTGVWRKCGARVVCSKIATTIDNETLYFAYIDNSIVRREDNLSKIEKCRHDIKEPLRNVANFLQLIKMQSSDDSEKDEKNYINFALKGLSTLCNFVDGLLLVDDGKFVDINLQLIISDIKQLLKSQIDEKRCEISIENGILINGIYPDILRFFKNLIENSMKHADANPLLISIDLICKNKNEIKILFHDNGSIPMPCKSRVIIENALTSQISDRVCCSGLGICAQIIRKHGGSLRLLNGEVGCAYEMVFPNCCRSRYGN